jgi:hypothetical protein
MKLSYLLLVDSASQGPEGKLNALGIGIRKFRPVTLPFAVSATLLAGVEVKRQDAGEHPLRIVLTGPTGKGVPLAEGKVDVKFGPDIDPRLPVTATTHFPLTGLVLNGSGLYRLRFELGSLRGTYAFVVDPPPTDADSDSGSHGASVQPRARKKSGLHAQR